MWHNYLLNNPSLDKVLVASQIPYNHPQAKASNKEPVETAHIYGREPQWSSQAHQNREKEEVDNTQSKLSTNGLSKDKPKPVKYLWHK